MSADNLAGLLLHSILVCMLACGLIAYFRSTGPYIRLAVRLERTWTGGKPLTCWLCMMFWTSAGIEALFHGDHGLGPLGWYDVVTVLGTACAFSLPLARISPMMPPSLSADPSAMPPLE